MLDANGFIVTKFNRKIDKISSAVRMLLNPVEFMTDEELLAVPAGSVFVFDVDLGFWAGFHNFAQAATNFSVANALEVLAKVGV